MQDEMFVCSNCQGEFPAYECYEIENDLLCPTCADELTVNCDSCGDRIYIADAVSDENYTLCESCRQNYFVVCEECGRLAPDPIFHGEGFRYFDVELEIDRGGKSCSNARTLLDISNADNENLYIKTDGSLDDGLELLTHPMTLEYHIRNMSWAKVLATGVC